MFLNACPAGNRDEFSAGCQRWRVCCPLVERCAGHDIAEVGWKDSKMSHCGILRLENLPRAERMLLLRDALERHGKDLSDGAIVIASSTKFRVRNPLQSENSK